MGIGKDVLTILEVVIKRIASRGLLATRVFNEGAPHDYFIKAILTFP